MHVINRYNVHADFWGQLTAADVVCPDRSIIDERSNGKTIWVWLLVTLQLPGTVLEQLIKTRSLIIITYIRIWGYLHVYEKQSDQFLLGGPGEEATCTPGWMFWRVGCWECNYSPQNVHETFLHHVIF